MRVVVIGDTHLPRFGRALPSDLVAGLAGAELIFHCGDLTEPFVLDLLEEHAPTVAVAGNNDGPELAERLGLSRVVEIGGARIGITHGHSGHGRRTVDRALATFADPQEPVDAICFGHSHVPMIERRGSVWMLNPGSPTDRRRQPTFSYLVLTISAGVISAELVEYASRRATSD